MGETVNVAAMAELLSQDIFNQFLWQGGASETPTNINWKCVKQELHRSGKAKRKVEVTHPTDVVFWYDEPYAPFRTYLNCDLKSYATDSINGANIRKALKSLANSVSCAASSMEWQEQFIHGGVSPIISGLLFIYNHDGGPDHKFNSILQAATKGLKLDLPPNSRIYVLGPTEVHRLSNIAVDIVGQKGLGVIPHDAKVTFFYPNLITRKLTASQVVRAATMEALTAPWLCFEHKKVDGEKNLIIYYTRSGEDRFEFIYLLDFILHYNLLETYNSINIRYVGKFNNAKSVFKRSIEEYIRLHGEIDQKRQTLSKIGFHTVRYVQPVFSESEIGMRDD